MNKTKDIYKEENDKIRMMHIEAQIGGLMKRIEFEKNLLPSDFIDEERLKLSSLTERYYELGGQQSQYPQGVQNE